MAAECKASFNTAPRSPRALYFHDGCYAQGSGLLRQLLRLLQAPRSGARREDVDRPELVHGAHSPNGQVMLLGKLTRSIKGFLGLLKIAFASQPAKHFQGIARDLPEVSLFRAFGEGLGLIELPSSGSHVRGQGVDRWR
jgi:hypothetical protein